ncbi:MAG: hypothetical protein NT102_07370 [Caldiserica bacterium]|nr:hypothetical protein [Caldisericota bacterium]
MDDAQSTLLRPEPTNPKCGPRIAEALGTRALHHRLNGHLCSQNA